MKELRASTVRILFVFDPQRQAVLLVAGDKAGRWKQWYDENIPVAEERYAKWLEGGQDREDVMTMARTWDQAKADRRERHPVDEDRVATSSGRCLPRCGRTG
jgi:hypothetical protein